MKCPKNAAQKPYTVRENTLVVLFSVQKDCFARGKELAWEIM